jgi:WD40 repeat protein
MLRLEFTMQESNDVAGSEGRGGALAAFRRALGREAHNLMRRPDLLWQQLYNRLQWEEDAVGKILAREHSSRTASASKPWMSIRTPFRESEALVRTLLHPDCVADCTVSPDGSFIVSASWDETIRIWDAHGGEPRASIPIGEKPESCALSPDGSRVICGWVEAGTPLTGALGLWNLGTGSLHQEFRADEDRQSRGSRELGSCAFSMDGSFVISVDAGMVRAWEPETGRRRWEFADVISLSPRACAMSPDGSYLVVAEKHELFWVLDAETARARKRFCDGALFPKQSSWKGIKEVVVAGLADLFPGLRTPGPSAEEPFYPEGRVMACAIAPDGRLIVSGHADGALKLWDVETGQKLAAVEAHAEAVRGCSVSPDRSLIASCSWDSTVKLWDASTGKHRATLLGHSDAVECCDFGPDGRTLISGGRDGKLIVWNVQRIEPATVPDAHEEKIWEEEEKDASQLRDPPRT